jgi:hypothetical protein
MERGKLKLGRVRREFGLRLEMRLFSGGGRMMRKLGRKDWGLGSVGALLYHCELTIIFDILVPSLGYREVP